MNIIWKLITKECPDYDFTRYRFNAGDLVTTLDGAVVVVDYSALKYVNGWVIRRGLKYRQLGEQHVLYDDLTYYKKGEFVSQPYPLSVSLKWKLYDFVKLDDYVLLLIEEKDRKQSFYAYVLESENGYYKNTRIYIENPYRDYIVTGGKYGRQVFRENI